MEDKLQKRKSILIVEDDETNLLLIRTIMRHLDVDIVEAFDGEEAVKIAAENDIDLILMDIRLPKLTGDKATLMIKNLKPQVPVIAQTAYALHQEKIQYEGIFDDYITKPIFEEDFLRKLKKYIDIQ